MQTDEIEATDAPKTDHLFKKGNQLGKGRVQKLVVAQDLDAEPSMDTVKEVMLAEFTVKDIRSMLRAQMNKAQRGDTNAAKFIRDGIWGKPKVVATDKEQSFLSALMAHAENRTIIDADNK